MTLGLRCPSCRSVLLPVEVGPGLDDDQPWSGALDLDCGPCSACGERPTLLVTVADVRDAIAATRRTA